MSAAATTRERRSTAGKRMSSLVGKALEDDEAFWGHDTWEDDDSGNDSFRESDEDSEARVDEFDSDFNDSESDHDAEEEAAGALEEAQLQRDEKSQKRKQKFDIVKAGRDLMQKKKGKGKKRAMGDGINAGLVLNMPPAAAAGLPPSAIAAAAVVPPPPVASPAKKKSTRRYSPRSPGKKRTLRAATVNKSQEAASKRKSTAASTSTTTTSTKKKQKRFTQEELLLEAATVTEPENERWLLARKRFQQTQDDLHKASQESKSGKIICKFRSRRGCLNSLTFPEMDHVPDILARKHVAPEKPEVPTVCVITGKKARYRDPKTMLGYHDIAAFKELRRRFNSGEKLDQRKKKFDMDIPMLEAEENGGKVAGVIHEGDSDQQSKDLFANVVTSSSEKAGAPEDPSSKLPNAAGEATMTAKPKATVLKVSKPVVSSIAVAAPATGRFSPRKRKLSAKAMAAVETDLLSPGKAPISNVILNMTLPQLDVANGPVSSAAHEETKSDSAVGKEVLKSLTEASASISAAGGSAGKDTDKPPSKKHNTS